MPMLTPRQKKLLAPYTDKEGYIEPLTKGEQQQYHLLLKKTVHSQLGQQKEKEELEILHLRYEVTELDNKEKADLKYQQDEHRKLEKSLKELQSQYEGALQKSSNNNIKSILKVYSIQKEIIEKRKKAEEVFEKIKWYQRRLLSSKENRKPKPFFSFFQNFERLQQQIQEATDEHADQRRSDFEILVNNFKNIGRKPIDLERGLSGIFPFLAQFFTPFVKMNHFLFSPKNKKLGLNFLIKTAMDSWMQKQGLKSSDEVNKFFQDNLKKSLPKEFQDHPLVTKSLLPITKGIASFIVRSNNPLHCDLSENRLLKIKRSLKKLVQEMWTSIDTIESNNPVSHKKIQELSKRLKGVVSALQDKNIKITTLTKQMKEFNVITADIQKYLKSGNKLNMESFYLSIGRLHEQQESLYFDFVQNSMDKIPQTKDLFQEIIQSQQLFEHRVFRPLSKKKQRLIARDQMQSMVSKLYTLCSYHPKLKKEQQELKTLMRDLQTGRADILEFLFDKMEKIQSINKRVLEFKSLKNTQQIKEILNAWKGSYRHNKIKPALFEAMQDKIRSLSLELKSICEDENLDKQSKEFDKLIAKLQVKNPTHPYTLHSNVTKIIAMTRAVRRALKNKSKPGVQLKIDEILEKLSSMKKPSSRSNISKIFQLSENVHKNFNKIIKLR